SSRRRHPTSKRDWSSDVCSSDLLQEQRPAGEGSSPARCPCSSARASSTASTGGCPSTSSFVRTRRSTGRRSETPAGRGSTGTTRSEERRVGEGGKDVEGEGV